MLAFNNISYNALPRVLAADNIPDRASGNDTLLVINRIGGNLLVGASPIGSIFGLLYNEAEQSHSFSFNTGQLSDCLYALKRLPAHDSAV